MMTIGHGQRRYVIIDVFGNDLQEDLEDRNYFVLFFLLISSLTILSDLKEISSFLHKSVVFNFFLIHQTQIIKLTQGICTSYKKKHHEASSLFGIYQLLNPIIVFFPLYS